MHFKDKSTIVFAAIIALILTLLLMLLVAQRAYDRELQFVEQFAFGKTENRAGLQLAAYEKDKRYLQVVLDEFFASPVITGAAFYAVDGTRIAGRDKKNPLSTNLPGLEVVRGDVAVADVSLTSLQDGSASGDTGFWTALAGGEDLHLTAPIVTASNASRRDLVMEDFVAAVRTAPSMKSMRVVGYLHVGIARGNILSQSLAAAAPLFAACLVLILLGCTALVLMTRRISQPLQELRRMADDVARGNTTEELKVPRNSEFWDLAEVLNTIVKSAQDRRNEVEVNKKLLDKRADETQSKLTEKDDRLDKAEQEIDAAKSKLHEMTYYDRLTSLPNRTLFREHLQLLLKKREREGKPLALLLANLDNFRRINDSFGYAAGDLVLTEVGKRLTQCLRESDLVGHGTDAKKAQLGVSRLAGDEFAIVLSSLDNAESAGLVAQRILDAVAQPIDVEGQDIIVSASVGIAIAPEHAADPEALTRAAGVAMHTVEPSPQGIFQFYNLDLEKAGLDELQLEAELRKAITDDELELHYQPQVDSVDGSILCAEALLRWDHPEHGMIPPGQFIPIARTIGLMPELGKWTTREACRQLKELRDKGLELPRISINVTADELSSSFADNLQTALETNGLEPGCLELGLSEIVVMSEDSEGYHCLQTLSGLGVHLSLDNFGISSIPLSHLNLYPLNELKIDRRIVSRCDLNKDNASLVKTIIAIADSLDLRTVAEGVETAEEFNLLMDCGARAVQGFLFSEPIPIHELQRQLEIPWYFMSQIQTIKLAQQGLA